MRRLPIRHEGGEKSDHESLSVQHEQSEPRSLGCRWRDVIDTVTSELISSRPFDIGIVPAIGIRCEEKTNKFENLWYLEQPLADLWALHRHQRLQQQQRVEDVAPSLLRLTKECVTKHQTSMSDERSTCNASQRRSSGTHLTATGRPGTPLAAGRPQCQRAREVVASDRNLTLFTQAGEKGPR